MDPMIIGLTGGIGSGKTVASNHFAELGVPIIDTDVIARIVVEPGQAALEKLVKEFGDSILFDEIDGERALNRDALREIAFASADNKAKLDAITHPAIRQETLRQLALVDYPYCIVVVPLLNAESPFTQFMQRIIAVNCEQETRIKRVMNRSQLSREAVTGIMDTQLSDAERTAFASDVINNDSTLEDVRLAVLSLHQEYLRICETKKNETNQ